MKVLLELRPALAGHAGIPQETRLLFRGLRQLRGVQVDGLLQSSNQLLARGLPVHDATMHGSPEERRATCARVAASLDPGDTVRMRRLLRLASASAATVAGTVIGRRQSLTRFEPEGLEDLLWQALFAKSLLPADYASVTSAQYRVARLPWSAAHASGLLTHSLGFAVYPTLDTADYDLMIAETPYPGRVSTPTRLVVRYHDAMPLLMPHTIANRAYHRATHLHALECNVRDGAWFACISEATRRDLISVFPQVEHRAVTIHNIVSHCYFVEDSDPSGVPDILRSRANTVIASRASVGDTRGIAADGSFAAPRLNYLLMVSTLEPRKNHTTLLAAWEQLRSEGKRDLHLVLVGMLGWNNDDILRRLLPWVARGEVHVLDDVAAAELRLLYRHAAATVCPSVGEGFGYSGIEAMCSGGVVVASDVPVHREVYGDAAEYFDPHSADELAHVLGRLIDVDAKTRRDELTRTGAMVASRYLPENVLPQWRVFFDQIASECSA